MKKTLLLLTLFFSLVACQGQDKKVTNKAPTVAIQKTETQWKKELTPEQYRVLRKKGTEQAFMGEYVNTFEKGKYVCAACSHVLFLSDAKFHSDCGWPSFDKALKGSVTYVTDATFGMTRTEVLCANCGGHLGHVFDDGPIETTGKRFCTNSVSITFIPKKKMKYSLEKSEEQWKSELGEERYRILRQKGTEAPHSGKYNLTYEKGIYCCGACGEPLFESNSKFDAHCGWPSFDESIPGKVEYIKDSTHGMIRTEILCTNCGSHLGHVFDDGPTKTGQRYCVNSLSVDFK